jgi:hypothetical protein
VTGASFNGRTSASWKTMVTDVVGMIALIWSIPVAIVLVGTPIVLVVALILMAARAVFG